MKEWIDIKINNCYIYIYEYKQYELNNGQYYMFK